MLKYLNTQHTNQCQKISNNYIGVTWVPLSYLSAAILACSSSCFCSSPCCMSWPPAWWALRLHWWPLAECSNVLMYILLIFRNVFVSVSLLYSVGNKSLLLLLLRLELQKFNIKSWNYWPFVRGNRNHRRLVLKIFSKPGKVSVSRRHHDIRVNCPDTR